MDDPGVADLHLHTNLGDGWISPARLVETAIHRRLRVVAVTDHDHVEGARRVEELLAGRDCAVQLITGVEVSTRHGHLLGLFVDKAPRPMRSVQESIDAIKEQGGLVIVPHPFGRLVPSLSRRRIDGLLAAGYEIDGIELPRRSQKRSSADVSIGAGPVRSSGEGPAPSRSADPMEGTMSTTANTTPNTTRTAGSRLGALLTTGVVATAAASAATVAVAAAGHAAGVSLDMAGAPIPVLGFGTLTAVFSLVGLVLAAALSRFARKPRRTFIRTTVVLTALSLVPDAIADAAPATKALLMFTHLVAAAIVIPAVARRLRP